MGAGKRGHKVTFEDKTPGVRGRLGSTKTPLSLHCTEWVELIHQRGDVAKDGGRVAGRQSLRVRLVATLKTRAIRPEFLMTIIASSEVYQVRLVDTFTQRGNVFLTVEGPLSPEAVNV